MTKVSSVTGKVTERLFRHTEDSDNDRLRQYGFAEKKHDMTEGYVLIVEDE